MKKTSLILVVDDEQKVRELLCAMLRKDGHEVIQAINGETALELMQSQAPDLAFVDIFMPGMDGLEVLGRMKELELTLPVIMMTGFGSMDTAIKAIRQGAYEYISKPFKLNKVHTLTRKCLEERRHQIERKPQAGQPQAERKRYEIIGSSESMVEVYKSIGAVSRTSNTANVLVLGESGTGKELVAQQIHSWGERENAPFVPINMTALPDSLIESELFGYEKGTFTGADKQKKGKFEEAGEGTLFLDEIGNLSINLQKKILRVLQEREFYRLGGMEVVPVKCRIITATNDDLPALIKSGEFRQDLYFRLKVVTIKMPPLRERADDIPHLTEYFLQQQAVEMKCSPPELSNEGIRLLCSYQWPGNVRELRNAIAQAMVFKHGDVLLPDDFPDLNEHQPASNLPDPNLTIEHARRLNNEEFERKYITQVLEKCQGQVSLAAELAGISPQRYYQLLKKHKISLDLFK